MWRGTKIHANPGLEAQHDEQPNLIPRKKLCAFLSVFLILTVLIFAAIFSLRYFILLKFEAPYRQVRFSIVSASMSGLNPNATLSSPPVLHIVFRAEKASENSKKTCLQSRYTYVLYNGIPITTADKHMMPPCYNMEYWSEFVLPVPLLGKYRLRNLREQLWEKRETAVLDLRIQFIAGCLPWNSYHVSCTNVMHGAPDVPVPCEELHKSWYQIPGYSGTGIQNFAFLFKGAAQ